LWGQLNYWFNKNIGFWASRRNPMNPWTYRKFNILNGKPAPVNPVINIKI